MHLFSCLHWASLLVNLLLLSYRETSCPALLDMIQIMIKKQRSFRLFIVLWNYGRRKWFGLASPPPAFGCMFSFISIIQFFSKHLNLEPEFYYSVARNLMCIVCFQQHLAEFKVVEEGEVVLCKQKWDTFWSQCYIKTESMR